MKFCIYSILLAAPSILAGCEQGKDTRPNVIVILADDLGYGDIGVYRNLFEKFEDGKPSAYLYTPHIDKLAQEGILFTRAYATGWCAPSRQALLSGKFANRTNAYSYPWIGNMMRQEGYVTGIFGKSHGEKQIEKTLENDSDLADFDDGLFFNGGMRSYYLGKDETMLGRINLSDTIFRFSDKDYLTDIFTDYAIDFIDRYADEEEPFFLYLPHLAPHSPLEGKPKDLKQLFPEVFGTMSDEEIRATANPRLNNVEMVNFHYEALVYALDRSIGEIRKKLTEKSIDENSVIIFTSDNGAIWGSNYPFSGHKWDGLEGGLRVPFIIWSSDIAKRGTSGTIYDGLVSIVDIASTILALAKDVNNYDYGDGLNILPFALGTIPPPEDRIYFWANNSDYNQLTGNTDFGLPINPGRLPQTVYIKENQKIIHWNTAGAEYMGAVFNQLPDVLESFNHRDLVAEKTPKINLFPESPEGKNLYKEMILFLKEQGSELVPYWSGSPAKIDQDLQWWYEKNSQR
jgi:arylsulfatase A-like enzyme